MSDEEFICTACHTRLWPTRSPIAGIILIFCSVLLIVGGVLMVRAAPIGTAIMVVLGLMLSAHGNRRLRWNTTCSACRSTSTIPVRSPAGEQLVKKKPA